MKRLAGILAGALMLLPATGHADPVRLETREAFLGRLANRVMADEAGSWVLIRPNGTLNGQNGRVTYTGRWHWSGTVLCRKLNRGPGIDPKQAAESCSRWSVDGNTVIYKRQSGEGPRSRTFTLRK